MENIRELKWLIEDFENVNLELVDMVSSWEVHGDPGSDPGLQYEKEMEREEAYNKIKAFIVKM